AKDNRALLSSLANAFHASETGKHVSFTQSYGASSEQAAAVAGGRKADVGSFSTPPDMQSLVGAKVVSPSWDTGRHHGTLADTLVVFVVRKGNPSDIHTWRTLTQPNVEVVFPNPYLAGAGKWDVLAAYGAQRKLGRSAVSAVNYLTALFRNTGVQNSTESQA